MKEELCHDKLEDVTAHLYFNGDWDGWTRCSFDILLFQWRLEDQTLCQTHDRKPYFFPDLARDIRHNTCACGTYTISEFRHTEIQFKQIIRLVHLKLINPNLSKRVLSQNKMTRQIWLDAYCRMIPKWSIFMQMSLDVLWPCTNPPTDTGSRLREAVRY